MPTVANVTDDAQMTTGSPTRRAIARDLLTEHRGYMARALRVQNHLVDLARREGLTWLEIADALGTKPDAPRKAMLKDRAANRVDA